MATMDELYQGVIIEHDRSPRNFGRLERPSHTAEARNPLCGDELALDLRLSAEGTIDEVAFEGRGCAVSKASASMLTVAVKGRTTGEARELATQFTALLTGKPADQKLLGKLGVFAGLASYPMRVKCATMAWHALLSALPTEKLEIGDRRSEG